MSKFTLDNRTLQLLKAQVNLCETFNHTLRTRPRPEALSFRLKVEPAPADTLFCVELGSERHTLILPNGPRAHLKLADFIEEIANGPFDPASRAKPAHVPRASRSYGMLDTENRQRVFELVHAGGFAKIEMGLDLPIHIAIHRTKNRNGLTVIMNIGVKRPHTKCFTLYGCDVELFEKIIESINHMAAAATPAAHAA
ncbi:hypothetical protein RZO07_10175 [Pseudomonas protegens]|uniref:hypothetical protein n=1 Tax=Pseudomonas protegens TaxID=380021 RepID=UPI002936F66D|nr:hypothetical protein [Pseudomonas protegens]WOE81568.1 hypothetical protein RZO07_10175 [Pseudomonas protegens]